MTNKKTTVQTYLVELSNIERYSTWIDGRPFVTNL